MKKNIHVLMVLSLVVLTVMGGEVMAEGAKKKLPTIAVFDFQLPSVNRGGNS